MSGYLGQRRENWGIYLLPKLSFNKILFTAPTLLSLSQVLDFSNCWYLLRYYGKNWPIFYHTVTLLD